MKKKMEVGDDAVTAYEGFSIITAVNNRKKLFMIDADRHKQKDFVWNEESQVWVDASRRRNIENMKKQGWVFEK